MLRALIYAYVLGGLTFIPLVILAVLFVSIYTSVPVGDGDGAKQLRGKLESKVVEDNEPAELEKDLLSLETNDHPRTRKGWLTMRRTFEELPGDGGYINLVRSFLDSRSQDPKKSKPKDMWYAVLKGKILYLYEDEDMTDCGAVVELGSHDIVVYPEGQTDGEMFAKRNAICLKPKDLSPAKFPPTLTKGMKLQEEDVDAVLDANHVSGRQREKEKERLAEGERRREVAREKEFDAPAPWFIFVRSNVEMEDWYFALVHASDHPAKTPTLSPLEAVFRAADMNHLVSTLDEQPDVIPMRWLNALIGRVFFSYYRTHTLESYIIGRLMKKLSKVKRPAFLTDIVVTEVSVGNRPPTLSKPMLKELTKEGDASMEVHLQYKGEIRITIEAIAIINLGQFKSYTVKLVLAAVLKELEGNLLIKIKRPPSSRIWYAFTQSPRMILQVEPIVSDRQIKWGMILSTIESKLKEIIQESVVMPNMDDIAFFESSLYEHRGGIWSDASRSERPQSSNPLASAADDPQSAVSAPPIITTEPSSEGSLPLTTRVSHSSESDGSDSRPASVIPVVQAQEVPMNDSGASDLSDRASEPFLGGGQQEQLPSVPPEIQSRDEISSELIEGADGGSPTLDPVLPHSRRSSMHSVKSHKSRLSIDSYPDRPSTPHKSLDPGSSPSPSPGPSFFSTLKSRAGDKQALGNTAREAMRKWGVNWSNLKKEFNSDENGDLTSKLRSKLEGAGNKRSSYAEVRAAVTERRVREANTQSEEEGSSSRSTSPIGDPKNKNPVSGEPISSLSGPSLTQQTAKLSANPVITSKKSLPSMSIVNTDIDASNDISGDEVRPAPIQAQPQAKTMTIPGIHASHRGEVMSMGYVAPQSSLLSDSIKPKNPAIQSVYRLWRNPTNAGQDDHTQASVKQTTAPATLDDQSSLPPKPSELIRQNPPPLPPRSAPSASVSNEDQPSMLAPLDEVQSKGMQLGEPISSLTDEMAADTTLMSSATTSSTSSPPPLPPRRISSTA